MPNKYGKKAMRVPKKRPYVPRGLLKTYYDVAKAEGLMPNDVKAAVEGILLFAVEQMKQTVSFELAGMLKLRHVYAPARSIYRMTVRAIPMKAFKDLFSEADAIPLPDGSVCSGSFV